MNLFFSGGLLDRVEYDPRLPAGVRYRLVSCHGAYVSAGKKVIEAMIDVGQPFELMLDSGAFTAWSKGHEVELDDLIEVYDSMLEAYGDSATATWLISLDKIPGEKGRTASESEIKEAIEISDNNFKVLRKRYGDIVLPVFHQNESSSRLHEVAKMSQYICVSPRNDLAEPSRRAWSKEVHALIPGKRTHGLAATGYAMMSQVPWGSVDSATWVLLAANGAVLYGPTLRAVHVSDESSNIKTRDQHIRTMSPAHQKAFAQFAESQGFNVPSLESDFFERMMFNRIMMEKTSRSLPAVVDAPKSIPLFDL